MSNQTPLAQELERFAKATLPPADAEDQDTIDFIRVIGLKLIQGKHQLQETRNLLQEISKDEQIINKFIDFFTSEKGKLEQEEEAKKREVEKVETQTTKQTQDGKIVINKSSSDIPAIYREVEEKKNKHRNQGYQERQQDRQRERKHEGKEIEKRFNTKTVNKGEKVETGDKKAQDSEAKQEEAGEKISQLPDLQGKSKCRFFPFCTNQNCEFFHPTEKCPKFPRCRFKEKCLYMHQACKFGESCTRADCFYDHPFKSRKSNNPLMNMMKMMMQANKPMNKPRRPAKPQNQQNEG